MAKNTPPGPGIDSSGQTVQDPTKNVMKIVKEAVRRQDDLRKTQFKSIRREIHLEVQQFHRELTDFKSYMKKINRTETKRINAIRKVDTDNVALANTAAENRATTLASQQVNQATASNIALKAETDPIRKDITDLRQSQWTLAGGKEQVTETKTDSRAKSNNWGVWVGIGVAAVMGVATIFATVTIAVITIVVTIYLNNH